MLIMCLLGAVLPSRRLTPGHSSTLGNEDEQSLIRQGSKQTGRINATGKKSFYNQNFQSHVIAERGGEQRAAAAPW